MRRAMLVLVILALVLAVGGILVALVNHRAARRVSDRAAEARAIDTGMALARRVKREGIRTPAALREAFEEALDDAVAYVALDVPGAGTAVSAGETPGLPEWFAQEALRTASEPTRTAARRTTEVGGEEVIEFAAPLGPGGQGLPWLGPGAPRGAMRRAWREVLGLGDVGAPGASGRPILRIGLRAEPLRGPVRTAALLLLLSLVVAPLLAVAAILASIVGRRAARLEAASARAAHLASLGELAATVAHEIRNPVAAIKGYAQLVEEGVGAEAGRRAARTIREETERLQRTVDGVLGYARNTPPSRKPCDLRDVAGEAAGRIAEAAGARGITLVRGYGDEPVVAALDRDQIARAVANLLDNALAAAPDGSRITLSLRTSRRDVEVAVADEGPGVLPAERDRLFEPFFTGRPGGTGLGLAVVRRIAEAHGGSVSVADRPGGGAEFVLRLPRD